LMVLTAPDAFAQVRTEQLAPLNNVTDYIVGFLTGPLATSVGIIGTAVVGMAFLAGRIAGGQAAAVAGGMAVLFGAAQIVGILRGVAGG